MRELGISSEFKLKTSPRYEVIGVESGYPTIFVEEETGTLIKEFNPTKSTSNPKAPVKLCDKKFGPEAVTDVVPDGTVNGTIPYPS